MSEIIAAHFRSMNEAAGRFKEDFEGKVTQFGVRPELLLYISEALYTNDLKLMLLETVTFPSPQPKQDESLLALFKRIKESQDKMHKHLDAVK